MKIGVFGDSFADRNSVSIWWKYLESIYGHDITSFGEGGSSLIFSAKKILENHQDYEFVIWCVTSSNRVTVWHRANHKEISVHVTGPGTQDHRDPEIQHKINVTKQYLLHAWDGIDEEFADRCVIEYVKSQVKNLLIIPCFSGPIFENAESAGFNLFALHQKETNFYFPNVPIEAVIDQYQENRPGHFTDSTQKKLAELISKSLTPGIFSTNYEDFPTPVESFDQVFRKK